MANLRALIAEPLSAPRPLPVGQDLDLFIDGRCLAIRRAVAALSPVIIATLSPRRAGAFDRFGLVLFFEFDLRLQSPLHVGICVRVAVNTVGLALLARDAGR